MARSSDNPALKFKNVDPPSLKAHRVQRAPELHDVLEQTVGDEVCG
jgi:hypothetical protein